ncbi:uncharacterized protein PV09_02641 [Verruconis gallopava]|uniref:Pyrroloquinoline quinone-dependent pyranose dehydrogenase beta-propeller domain-containing protein n=1 Tax=Verruconis gallopava TaxID=253628 RepID=A0A0D1Z233_9PEZI|nr:uncharacterized protein PV09_02641 [Verruconis gallopava]KIW06982.1 hypothetical protein PV09_02641 [Verruconis gallopava]
MISTLVPLVLATVPAVLAQSSCSAPELTASYPAPTLAAGYAARLVASGLQRPRGIKFDTKGRLLVVEQSLGIQAITFNDYGGDCLSVKSKDAVVNDDQLNHGIELSGDGRTLYASTSDVAYSYDYNPDDHSTSNRRTLITGMDNPDHSTRTLLLSKMADGMLLVSRGSADNYDAGAASLSTGRSQIRAFNISNLTSSDTYDYTTQGLRLGWGLRNSVGIAEHPETGGIYSVENSVDNAERLGQDIHENNPGEEMNFHGYLNGTHYASQGGNYGYPTCFAAWNASLLPDNQGIETGTQFALGTPNNTVNDDVCKNDHVAPRLTFPAHWAPLDIKFNSNGSVAYVTSHGSWNRDNPDGYLVFALEFANGEPTHPANSTDAILPIMSNVNNSGCPDNCFRPVSLAFDSKGRLFVSADSSGAIFVITRADGSSVDALGNATSTSKPSSANGLIVNSGWALLLGAAVAMVLVL